MKLSSARRSLFSLTAFALVLPLSSPDAMGKRDAERIVTPLISPRIRIVKSTRTLELYSDHQLMKTYAIALGSTPTGEKRREGDRRTPEGKFYLTGRNPKSAYYLSLTIGYPNRQEAEAGLKAGLITSKQHKAILQAYRNRRTPPQNTKLGGNIMIHGGGTETDWTWGCVALENKNIRELYRVLPLGTVIEIDP